MKKSSQVETIPSVVVDSLSLEDRKERDKRGRDERSLLDQPPERIREKLKMNREQTKEAVARYCKKVEANLSAELRHRVYLRRMSSLEERIKRYVRDNTTDGIRDGDLVFKKPLRQMIDYLTQFDWRGFGVVPRVRNQGDKNATCWAFVATEAFESSLMIQRARFAIQDLRKASYEDQVRLDPVMLNINSTLKNVFPHDNPLASGGRYESAFNHYFENGIPVKELNINPVEKSEDTNVEIINASSGEKRRRSTRTKAIAWDWVSDSPWIAPVGDAARQEIKEALLEYGPLAVLISFDGGFKTYGVPGSEFPAGDDSASAPAGMNLRFPADTVQFRKDETTGKLFLYVPWDIADFETDKDTDDLIMRFAADKRPILEPRPKEQSRRRPTDGDDAVVFNVSTREIEFTVNNTVDAMMDAVTGELVLQFPANTNALFTPVTAVMPRIVRFPADNAPIFVANEGAHPNHFALLIGWNEDKCAWTILNSYGTEWGYQCNGPNLKRDTQTKIAASEDRGYMYVAYDSPLFGHYAAWIEGRLHRTGLW